ncbi:hypothetical protein KIN20_038317 [Parelaphostrongylus tenuis]|uniref:Uncharacterized protein n=1 Tax=Parelaphostrongylus tenuis TaxID=148309 RepID=A0AAD5WLH6_PARTN|nr:hypothetical protein KIN20_038317 [Parelaphostrongylus tenuis]
MKHYPAPNPSSSIVKMSEETEEMQRKEHYPARILHRDSENERRNREMRRKEVLFLFSDSPLRGCNARCGERGLSRAP